MVCIVALVGEQTTERTGGANQCLSHADVVDVSGAEHEHARTPTIIDKDMQLCRPTAPGATYGLAEGLPFAPAAERCALTWVASIAAPSKMPLGPVRASNICSHSPWRLQRLKRL